MADERENPPASSEDTDSGTDGAERAAKPLDWEAEVNNLGGAQMPDDLEEATSIGVPAVRRLLSSLEEMEADGAEVAEVVVGFRLIKGGVDAPYIFVSPGSALLLVGLASWIQETMKAKLAASISFPVPESTATEAEETP